MSKFPLVGDGDGILFAVLFIGTWISWKVRGRL